MKQRVASLKDLPRGALKRVNVAETPLCLARTEDGNVYAIHDICTHEASSLSEGTLEGVEVECPSHSSRFDVRTGDVTWLPATRGVQKYGVEIEDGEIYVYV